MKIEEVKAYKVNNSLFEKKEEAEKEVAKEELKDLVAGIYYRGIDESALLDSIIENKNKLIGILSKI